jgi:putative ABC transport system permease protein
MTLGFNRFVENKSQNGSMFIFDRDNWAEIYATLKANKIRTLLTVFGVFWGIFMLVIMLGSGKGLENGIMKDFGGSATNSFFCWAQKTSKPYKGMKAGRNYEFNNNDFKLLQTLPDLETVVPMNQLGGYGGENQIVRGIKTNTLPVMGTYPALAKIQAIQVKKGRFINLNDIQENRKVVVIGKKAEETLFGKTENPLGQYIRINGVYFQVIGITQPGSSGQNPEEEISTLYLPFTTFQKAFNFGDIVGWFSVTAKKNVSVDQAEEATIALLKRNHQISPEDPMAVGHWNMGKEFSKIKGLFMGISVLVWFVGTGTLIAGVIGVSNIMLIVVKERTREIGVKRALGASPFEIMFQIILESLVLTFVAGYTGLIAGVGILKIVSESLPSDENSMFTNPSVDLQVALTALGILILSGLLAGFIPARKALQIEPVEALRAE